MENKNEQQVPEIMPEPIEEPKKSKKGQMAKGVACGIAGTILVGFVALNVVTKITGTKIYITNATAKTDSILDTKTVQKINELKAYTDMYYYDDVDDTELKDGLYEGMISGLGDKYSVYYNEEDYKQMHVSTTGQYYGIGAGLRQDPDTMVVSISKIYEGTPSDEAGLLADDVITSVDGTDATSMEVTELVKLIRGEEGTSVHLEVYRPSTGENLSFDVERKNVTLPSVSSQMLGDNIGYIHIDSFETETADQFEKAVAELDSEGMKALVLDVRYNGGGLVTAVVQILDDILPEGTVVYTEEDVNSQIATLLSGNPVREQKKGPLAMGDTAVIDYEGFKDGVAFEGGKAEKYPLGIGSGSFIPGFEEQLVGMEIGEDRDINLSFPEQYHAPELAGKAVVFKVKLHEIYNEKEAELNDEFAASLNFPEVQSVEDLKKYINEYLEYQVEARKADAAREKLYDQILESSSCLVSPQAVETAHSGCKE